MATASPSSSRRSSSGPAILCSPLRTQSSPSVRFDRLISPSPRSISSVPSRSNTIKRSCMCSPSTHPGSFRCRLHKNTNINNTTTNTTAPHPQPQQTTSHFPSNGLDVRRSAMVNSLVRIGTVEGELLKRALTALIRPSSHHLRRHAVFQPRPSRLSIMSKADDLN